MVSRSADILLLVLSPCVSGIRLPNKYTQCVMRMMRARAESEKWCSLQSNRAMSWASVFFMSRATGMLMLLTCATALPSQPCSCHCERKRPRINEANFKQPDMPGDDPLTGGLALTLFLLERDRYYPVGCHALFCFVKYYYFSHLARAYRQCDSVLYHPTTIP